MQYLYKNRVAQLVLALGIMGFVFLIRTPHAAAAACTTPGTDYGTVTFDNTTTTNHFSAPAANVAYRVWTRMAVPDATNVNFLLEVEGTTDAGGKSCFTVGSANIPASPDLATTSTTPTTVNWTWVNYSGTNTGSTNTVTFATAGPHTVKLIGNAPNVAVDRVIFADPSSSSCNVNMGTGDSCTADSTAPTPVTVTAPTNGSTTTTTPVNITATASDDSGTVSKVEFYVDGVLKGTDSAGPAFSYSWSTTGLTGSHTIYAKAYDPSNNVGTSPTITVTVNNTSAAVPGDVDGDTHVNLTDLSIVGQNYGKSGMLRTQGNLDGDTAGIVNIYDLSILGQNWGK